MFAALDQRIATRFEIKPMDLAEQPPTCDSPQARGRVDPLFAMMRLPGPRAAADGRAVNNVCCCSADRCCGSWEGNLHPIDACAKKAVLLSQPRLAGPHRASPMKILPRRGRVRQPPPEAETCVRPPSSAAPPRRRPASRLDACSSKRLLFSASLLGGPSVPRLAASDVKTPANLPEHGHQMPPTPCATLWPLTTVPILDPRPLGKNLLAQFGIVCIDGVIRTASVAAGAPVVP